VFSVKLVAFKLLDFLLEREDGLLKLLDYFPLAHHVSEGETAFEPVLHHLFLLLEAELSIGVAVLLDDLLDDIVVDIPDS